MMVAQHDMKGSMLQSVVRCQRCHRQLKDPVSIQHGFGPVCWGKVQAASLQDANRNEPRTITHPAIAEAEIRKLTALVDMYSCACGAKFADKGEVWSFNHEHGLNLVGFGEPQWVYVHCLKCGHDTALWKLMGLGE